MLTKKSQKVLEKYFCKDCDYSTSYKKDFNKHLLTDKHKMLTNVDKELPKVLKKDFSCECGKIYKHRQSLNVHKKKCNYNNLEIENKIIDNNLDYKSMFVTMMKENQELRKQVTDLLPKVGNTTIHNNTNNTVNQNFNFQLFLNENCSNALNMSDFIKSIEISLDQLDYTKKNGLVDGLSSAIVENMSKLSLYERPLHCSDLKHETLFIKEDNKWQMDDNKDSIKEVIKKISNKNYSALQNWKQQNPDFGENDKKKDYFVQSLSNISKDSKEIDNNKIIKTICESVYVK
tara:strand:+ start:5545 stop:6411 length:867 start_codon:yes stop_codon:yes gene_type:complete